MRIAKEGYPLIFAAAILAAAALVMGWLLLGAFLGLLTLAVASFFRDPDRVIPGGEGLITQSIGQSIRARFGARLS